MENKEIKLTNKEIEVIQKDFKIYVSEWDRKLKSMMSHRVNYEELVCFNVVTAELRDFMFKQFERYIQDYEGKLENLKFYIGIPLSSFIKTMEKLLRFKFQDLIGCEEVLKHIEGIKKFDLEKVLAQRKSTIRN